MAKRYQTLRLILGDQLNPCHSWLSQLCPDVLYVLMEVRQETDYVTHHAQKVLAIFAAMRAFAQELQQKGHCVLYVALDDPENQQSITKNLDHYLRHYQATCCQWQEPDEWRLDQQLKEWSNACHWQTNSVSTEHFYTSPAQVADFFRERKQWIMEPFYRHLRRQHGILLQADGQPIGGRWNFDAQNRQPWRGQPPVPADHRPRYDYRTLWQSMLAHGVKTVGHAQAAQIRWPQNRQDAFAWLKRFIHDALPNFGHYEDAMSSHSRRLFHSQLSFALNTKMLRPHDVVREVEAAYHRDDIPLAATEGMIRQILGWREYVRAVYWLKMPDFVEQNYFEHQLPLPAWFWTGQTHMRCLREVIHQTLEDAYAHHIQRLMIIGNFTLLAGIDPKQIHRWFLSVYIDAFEWVELPNTLGMSQFADGGHLATKPYVCSAAYIDKMSDYCRDCPYQKKQRLADNACPLNSLYWDFFRRNASRLTNNPRLALVYRQLTRMPAATQSALAHKAQQIRQHLDTL